MNVMANPLSMFDVKDNVALITGASGAFGMVAARILAGAGCKLVLVAGNQTALDEISKECTDMGADVTCINSRPTTEEVCNDLVAKAVGRLWPPRHSRCGVRYEQGCSDYRNGASHL